MAARERSLSDTFRAFFAKFFERPLIVVSAPFYLSNSWQILVGDKSGYQFKRFSSFSEADTELIATKSAVGMAAGYVSFKIVEVDVKQVPSITDLKSYQRVVAASVR